MMKKNSPKKYFAKGVVFLREHPQLWFTAFVGIAILAAFIFTAWRFASIAEDAQEQLINVRIGSILDAFVLFVPDVLEKPSVLRTRIASIREQNITIDSFTIYAEHGNSEWRVYISDNGPREGTVNEAGNDIFSLAKANPQSAYTAEIAGVGGRHFITARAIVDDGGRVIALAVANQALSEADKLISRNIQTSAYLLFGVLFIIMILFLRHARIVDFAVLYKKQLEIDEMKDSFISMASHELKSPLSVIRGYVEFLKDGVEEESQRQEFLRRIDVSANELRQLVDDILDVSRIEMGRLRFASDHVKSSEVLGEVVEMFTEQAKKKNLTISLDIKEDVQDSVIRVDRGRLKQVMVNLASNAVKYTLKGDIVVAQKKVDGKMELSVRDSGVGMTADEQKKLFGKFYRAEADETKGVSGTGLGLWITKYIIEQMKGEISVESIKGEGSRFVVRFPVYEK